MTGDAAPIEALRNLGPKSGAVLREAGMLTIADRRAVGAIAAFARVCAIWDGASLNLLWALAAGLQDRDWRTLHPVEKRALVDGLDTLKPLRGQPQAQPRAP